MLPAPIDVNKYKDDNEVFDVAYDIFCKDLQNRDVRPNLFGKFIYINERMGERGKSKGYWHIASIGADDSKFDMDPCVNDATNRMCRFLCDVDHEENYLREDNSIPCLYRACKINWIRKIIELANNDKYNQKLKVWIWKDRETKEKTLKIRYIDIENRIDYVVIFAIKYKNNNNYYLLKTAFPVVLKSWRRRFDYEYKKFECEK